MNFYYQKEKTGYETGSIAKGGTTMSYEELAREIEKEGVELIESKFNSENIKGLYVDNIITVNSNISTEKEKKCILAEEIGHYYTSYGNILDQSKLENRKQERKARGWAYEKLVGIVDLINAFKYGVKNRYELSEYLNVTEEFIEEAIKYYKEKYGLYYQIDNYVVYFEPLAILERRE